MPASDPIPLKISEIENPKFKIDLNGEVKSFDPFDLYHKIISQGSTPLHDAVLSSCGITPEQLPHDCSPRYITMAIWSQLQDFIEGLDFSKKLVARERQNSSSAPKSPQAS